MFGSTVLEVAISLVLIYILLSLMCSACTEWVAKRLSLRATTLEAGLRSLLSDPQGEEIAKSVYSHPLIKGLVPPMRYMTPQGRSLPNLIVSLITRLARHPQQQTSMIGPSYIPARTFALALMDVVAPVHQNDSHSLDQLRQSISTLQNLELRQSLLTLIDDAQGDSIRARQNIEQWFDDAMTRVSGWYKRDIQRFTFFFALVVTLVLNTDTLVIANTFWRDDATRAAAVAYAQQVVNQTQSTSSTPQSTTDDTVKRVAEVQQNLQGLGLPLGWRADADRASTLLASSEAGVGLLTWAAAKVAGLWLTTLAVSMGAPFWFDVLNKLVSLRSSGKPPTQSIRVRRTHVTEVSSPAAANGVVSVVSQ